jgi:UDP-glucose 4-epimerase
MTNAMNVLLTGGTGYIASHAGIILASAGHRVVLLNNLSNSRRKVIAHTKAIVAAECGDASADQRVHFIQAVTRDAGRVSEALISFSIEAVIHFAGLKAVGESVEKPLEHFDNNVGGTISLLRALRGTNCRTLVFSSSATVYGDPQRLPLDEDHPTRATNPYGRTKLHIEEMLADLAAAEPGWDIACLRYFNPVGAHESGLIGEDPTGTPDNLVPYITRVALGALSELSSFGDCYSTIDGTGVRDYIHVMDLAEGHFAALNFLVRMRAQIGTGQLHSVFEMIHAFEAASGCSVQYRVVGRHPGDIAACYADSGKANRLPGCWAERTVAADVRVHLAAPATNLAATGEVNIQD